jgi:tetratricopeptide (TPR) repeat protein
VSSDQGGRDIGSPFGASSGTFSPFRWGTLALLLALTACQSSGQNTIAQLRNTQIEIKEEKIEDVPEKAMESYQSFLEKTPESTLRPEAIRRLADLKIERETGLPADEPAPEQGPAAATPAAPEPAVKELPAPAVPAKVPTLPDRRSATKEPAASRPEPAPETREPSVSASTVKELPAPAPPSNAPAVSKAGTAAKALTAPERVVRLDEVPKAPTVPVPVLTDTHEAQEVFEKRAVETPMPIGAAAAEKPTGRAARPEGADAREAIKLYTKLLKDYPTYDRNDQVLYQMSRAYEELGQVDESKQTLDRLVRDHPRSRHIDEAQFRRGEYYFTRKRYSDAEAAYSSVVVFGAASPYFELALYKEGWSRYKQERYEKGLDSFLALLDHKVTRGVDVAWPLDEAERKRVDDTLRVVSLSFSNLGGASSVADYFTRRGGRAYEDRVYSNLGEFYFDKNRYGDAAAVYSTFIQQHPFHRVSPQFQMRVIEIHLAGGFPSRVIDAKKDFARWYGVKADYWRHFERNDRLDVLLWLKANLNDLAKHYHALYQSPKQAQKKQMNFEEAVQWYRELITSFPRDLDTPPMNYLLADLYMEHRVFDRAAVEYERTAFDYSRYEQSAQAGYAAVYAWRQHLAGIAPDARPAVIKEIVRCSIKFSDAFAKHPKAAIVLGAAADDLFELRDYPTAAFVSHKLVEGFPNAERDVMAQALLVFGHSSYELRRYRDAETGYAKMLELLPAEDKRREILTDNLAASIYKLGEEAKAKGNHLAAASHFLKVGSAAPNSKIRVNAEYDGAASLIEIKDWLLASTVLKRFRTLFPGHELQPEVTKKLAYVYREMNAYVAAAEEYERIAQETTDDEVRREALLSAAEMHEKAGDAVRLLAAYRRYVELYPSPLELNLETRSRIADLLKKGGERDAQDAELHQIVALEAGAGGDRTPRTRFLAAQAGLTLAQGAYDRFVEVKLVEPFEANLSRKQELMKAATQEFNGLVEYEIGDVIAAATYYLAEIYAHFSKDLKESERPAGLSALEREEYDLAIEEQAYPFEERCIATHQSNLELIPRGVYNQWIEKSMQRLAALVPARYEKPEEGSGVITTPDRYVYVIGQSVPHFRPVARASEPEPASPRETPAEKARTEAAPQDAKPAEAADTAKVEQPKPVEAPAEKPAKAQQKAKKTAKPKGAKKAAAKKQKKGTEKAPETAAERKTGTGAP